MKKIQRGIWIVIGLVALLFLLGQFSFMDGPKNLLRSTLAYPGSGVDTIIGKSKTLFGLLGSINDLSKKNYLLSQENNDLKAQLAKQKMIEGENEQLRKDLKFKEIRPELDLLPANIVAYSPIKSYNTIIIDKGQSDGVKEGQAVVSSGYLLGKVKSVTASSAEIWVVGSRNLTIPVLIPGTNQVGLLKGGVSGVQVEDVPLDAKVNKGDTIVTSSLEGLYPAGIAIGEVSDIASKKEQIFMSLKVNSPINLGKLSSLFVVK